MVLHVTRVLVGVSTRECATQSCLKNHAAQRPNGLKPRALELCHRARVVGVDDETMLLGADELGSGNTLLK
jgi:hypothetical protein